MKSPTPSSMDKLGPIVHQTLAGRVYHDLRELIISGQLTPGEKLTLAGLAGALGTSAMPVREAINKLAAEEALEFMPNKSVRVPVMTRRQFQDLVIIRLVVEGLAVERAAANITAEELAQLEALERAFEEEISRPEPDVNKIIRTNKQLHFTAYAAAQMPTLNSLIENLWLRLGPVLSLDLRNSASRRRADPPSILAHHSLVDALRRRDGAAAKEALAMDINCAAEVILSGSGLAEG